MELLQLQYFLRLANCPHVTQTANELHISQPSLSATVKKLESELGVQLFLRKGRNIVLSPYGEAFRQYVEEAFLALENGKTVLERMRGAEDTGLRLGILSPYIWNELFRQFYEVCPDARISRFSIEDDQFSESILDGKIDLYLGGVNGIESKDLSRLDYAMLYEDDMVLLVSDRHPLAGRKEIDLRDCRDERFIHLEERTSLQQFINGMFARAGFSPRVVMVCDYTLRDRMVSENHGVSVTTRLAAEKTEVKDVSYLIIRDPPVKRKLGLVWRKGREFSLPMQKFFDTARDFYRDISL